MQFFDQKLKIGIFLALIKEKQKTVQVQQAIVGWTQNWFLQTIENKRHLAFHAVKDKTEKTNIGYKILGKCRF